ncbi:MAG: hypothetical protein NT069_03790 [Planctomycetota bacterium]|nr:hypothetical protein [Planctomycetota bacterium]
MKSAENRGEIRETRRLTGLVVGVSVSESESSADLGYTSDEINLAIVRIAAVLFGEGARLVFGHTWRPDGVMDEVLRLALRVSHAHNAPLVNFLAWPNQPGLTMVQRRQLESTLEIREIDRPADTHLPQTESPSGSADVEIWPRARTLTEMRRQMAKTVDAQICIGGKIHGAAGRFPGVVEEAYFATRANKPIYFSGFLGGATMEMIRAIRGETYSPDLFRPAEKVRVAFQNANSPNMVPDASLESDCVKRYFESELTMDRICQTNLLTAAENTVMWDATGIDPAIVMILRGLLRVNAARTATGRHTTR